jgi:uncharacterized protein YlxW (UPF0749 family)
MNGWLGYLALLAGLTGLVAGVLALRTLARLRRSVALLSRGTSGRETILDAAEKHMAASEAVRKDILELQRDLTTAHQDMQTQLATERAELAQTVRELGAAVGSVLRRVALVRYDAFDDLSGRLSFSLALLDDHGNGITLTSIASPSDTRLYAKSLTGGIGEHALSPEEEQAVRAALA